MNKKIIISLSVIAAVAAIVIGGTVAFFSDTETSTGNIFTAGAIDLKISNESYVSNQTNGALEYSQPTSWEAKDLTVEKFFEFNDLKPGDIGEDTINFTVINNDAWACAEVTLTSNKDNDCTEPEFGDDASCGTGDENWNGDLAQGIQFIWWSDDGDNVLEDDEVASMYYLGPDSIKNLVGENNILQLTLADSYLNFFDRTRKDLSQTVLPIKGGETKFIGKAWCFGEMTLTPVLQDGKGKLPDSTNGPLVRGTGFACDGSAVDNAAQTDSLTADISFYVEQARNNMNFLCPEHQPEIIEVTSAMMEFSSTGWAGWSCPTTHPNIVEGTTNCSQLLTHSLAWEPGASVAGVNYPETPFGYTYGSGEEGWIVQNGGTPQSCNIILQCQAN